MAIESDLYPKFTDVLRTHADSMWRGGWYTISMALEKAANRIDELEAEKEKDHDRG